jgi:hypothetical protein
MATVINRPVIVYNAEVVKRIWLQDSAGNKIHLRGRLAGDIALVKPKMALVRGEVDGKPIGTVSGATAPGSITIPLHADALTDCIQSGFPTLDEILNQTNLGTTFSPYTSSTGTDPDGDTFGYGATPRAKMWMICIELDHKRGGVREATKNTMITVYAEVANPDVSIANNGGISAYTLMGEIPREGHVSITNV